MYIVTDMKDFKKYIITDESIRLGKPCVKGTKISVSDVLNRFAAGKSEKAILKEFPDLNQTKISACLAYHTANT